MTTLSLISSQGQITTLLEMRKGPDITLTSHWMTLVSWIVTIWQFYTTSYCQSFTVFKQNFAFYQNMHVKFSLKFGAEFNPELVLVSAGYDAGTVAIFCKSTRIASSLLLQLLVVPKAKCFSHLLFMLTPLIAWKPLPMESFVSATLNDSLR